MHPRKEHNIALIAKEWIGRYCPSDVTETRHITWESSTGPREQKRIISGVNTLRCRLGRFGPPSEGLHDI